MPIQVSSLVRRWAVPLAALTVTVALAAVSPAQAQSISAPLSVTTLAGSAGTSGFATGTGSSALFYGPSGLIVSSDGSVTIADAANNIIRTVTTAGVTATLAGTPADANNPINVGSSDGTGGAASFHIGQTHDTIGSNTVGIDTAGNVYVADTLNYTIRKITPGGVVTTIAGQANSYGSADGTGTNARFLAPGGVAADASGNVFVADSGNDTIRKIALDGTVTTFAGQARSFGSTDGTGAAARFNDPEGIAADSSGNLYVTDKGNNIIRKITPSGIVSTLAGSPGHTGSTDGTGSQARFNGPLGIAVDAAGNVYVADTGNNIVRMITPSGSVTTIAGSAGVTGSTDGTGTSAKFNHPYGVAVRADGSAVFIADTMNDTIRIGVPATSSGSLTISEVPPTLVQVVATKSVTLKVVATGNPTPTYQWTKDGVAISGATSNTLSLSSVSSANAGAYSVTVTSGSAVFKTAPTTLQVFADASTPVPVEIVSQPADRTITAGQSTTFTVEASSTNPLTYQWSKDGNAISGATSATYTIAAAQTGDAGSYTVAINDGVNTTATTTGATLTVSGGGAIVAPTFTTQPISQTFVAGSTITLTGVASGNPTPTYQWQKDGTNLANSATIAGATTGTLTLNSTTAADAGNYTLLATNSAGTSVSSVAVLSVAGAIAPTITTQPSATTVAPGASATFTVQATGTPSPTFQWRKNGTNLTNGSGASGVTTATLTLTGVSASDAGDYSVVVTNSAGSVTSNTATLTVSSTAGPNAWLTNVSVRTKMTAGQDPLIVGFGTNGAKDVLIRGAGPALYQYFTDYLPDPSIQLYRQSDSTQVGANDTWDSSLAPLFNSLGAYPFTAGSKDAAMVKNVNGTYSTWELATGTGIVLVEAYDATPSVNLPRLVNVSARNFVGTGSNILIAGFSIAGTGTKHLLIRAVGPELATYHVANVLTDPKLEIYDSNNVLVATNDNWDSSLTPTFDAVYAFHLTNGSKDAAIVVDLPAGHTYTAQVKGANGETGVALVEVYEVP